MQPWKIGVALFVFVALGYVVWLSIDGRRGLGINAEEFADSALTVWWTSPESLPQWTFYNFDMANGEIIPAVCSAMIRLRRDGNAQVAIFIGTGYEHLNRLLIVDGQSFVDVGVKCGITTMPEPRLSVYCAAAFDPHGRGLDDILIGRSDGVWYLRALGGANTQYSAIKILESPENSPIPLQLCVSMGEPEMIGDFTTVVPQKTSQIWSSFYIPLAALRTQTDGKNTWVTPLAAALEGRLIVVGALNSQQWFADSGNYSMTPPRHRALTNSCVYCWRGGVEPRQIALSLPAVKSPLQLLEPTAATNEHLEKAARGFVSEDRDLVGTSKHVLGRPGAVISDGHTRSGEANNDLEMRRQQVTQQKRRDAAITEAAKLQEFKLVVLYATPHNTLTNGRIGRRTLFAHLRATKQPRTVKFSVAAPAAAPGTVTVSAAGDVISTIKETREGFARVSVPMDRWRQSATVRINNWTLYLDDVSRGWLQMRPTIVIL